MNRSWLFGMATAAQQVEGGIVGTDWEVFARDPQIARRVGALLSVGGQPAAPTLQPPGDAVRHGDLQTLKADLDRARMLGANAYRFSIEWARLEPTPDEWRGEVLDGYYLKVVAELHARGLEPVVTLQHLSLPAWVLTPPSRTRWLGPIPFASGSDPGFRRSLRGWEAPATVDAFAAFVERVVPALRDAGVRWWIPLNEPTGSVVGLGYIGGIWPPGFTVDGRRARAAHLNLVRAHVRAFDIIKAGDREAKVGLAHALTPFRSLRRAGPLRRADDNAARQADYFFNLHFLDSVVAGRVDVAVNARRPRFVPAQEFLGTGETRWRPRLDFIGVNYYRPFTIRWHPLIALKARLAGGLLTNIPVPVATDAGNKVEPGGLGEVIRRVYGRYHLPVLVTENGIAESSDRIRSPHLIAHLESVRAAEAAGIPVLGYLYWSLLDNWEWDSGYDPSSRNGLFSVDFESPPQPRSLTEAALAFRDLAQGGSLEEARARYGSIAPDGSAVVLPTRGPSPVWRRHDDCGEWLAVDGLVFDPARGSWGERAAGERDRLVGGWSRDWRDGLWLTDGSAAPFRALRVSALGRWESSGQAVERWTARAHDGITWHRLGCSVSDGCIRLSTHPAIELLLKSEALVPSTGAAWTLRRLPDNGSSPA